MTGAEMLDLQLPNVRMRALAWGPEAGRLVLCVHGFPDSARSWRHLGPMLAERGFRVVAPFTRGYWPTEIPSDGNYHIGALMSDVLDLHRHLEGGDDAILIGHDWGGITTNAIAATPESPFARHICLGIPPFGSIDRSAAGGALQELKMLAVQLRMSWYILFFQIPVLPPRLLHRIIPRLWRDWSPPGADVRVGTSDALDALPSVANRVAAVSYYRSMVRWWTRPGMTYADLNRYRFELPLVPMLFMHGRQDGAMQVLYTRNVTNVLPPGSRMEIIDGAGHFLQVDQPVAVCAAILGYLAEDADGRATGGG